MTSSDRFICINCGKATNNRGRLFKSKQARNDHQRACSPRKLEDCGPMSPDEIAFLLDIHGPDLSLTTLIADDDMPDGAFFALAHELGEL